MKESAFDPICFIILLFLTIASSSARDMDDSAEWGVKAPLLRNMNLEANDKIQSNEIQGIEALPNDLFFPIAFECMNYNHKNDGKNSAIRALCNISKLLNVRVYDLIPRHLLRRTPLPLDVLYFVGEVERCLKKGGHQLIEKLLQFPLYRMDIQRLHTEDALFRYSPQFFYYQGTQRTENIKAVHLSLDAKLF